MALKDSRGGRWWSRLHFVIRLLGITGLAAVIVGLTVLLIDEITWEAAVAHWAMLQAAVQGQSQQYPRRAFLLFMAGAVVVLFWLFLEALIVIRLVAGRRSASGFSTIVQIGLATALLIGVNVYSYQHYRIFDLTSDHKFTLPTEPVNIPAELAKLNDETTILVYMRHKTFGPLSDKPDAYDFAAERKVVEKVKDLADLFREFGKQFKVEVLEIEEDGYDAKRDKILGTLAEEAVNSKPASRDLSDEERKKEIKKKTDDLRERVEGVPENSIFFFAGDRLQRLSFNDFYQLDKTASKEAGGGRGNLVLLFQGIGPFARRALDIDQRRPKVGVLVVHEYLTTEMPEAIGLKGVRSALQAHGIDVKDIVLRNWNENEPSAYTFEESRADRLEAIMAALDEGIPELEKSVKAIADVRKHLQKASLEELAKEARVPKFTEEDRQFNLKRLQLVLADREAQLAEMRDIRDDSSKEYGQLKNTEGLAEQQRLPDLKAKMERQLADCDMIIIPRLTYMNLVRDWYYSNDVHKLDALQIAAIKDYIKKGKPVLACLGPVNEPGPAPGMPGKATGDDVEDLFEQLGFQLGKSVVLYNADARAFADQRAKRLVAGFDVDVPPVEFNWGPEALRPVGKLALEDLDTTPNPIRHSMQIAQRSVGKPLNIHSHYPRPIGVDPKKAKDQAFEPVIMISGSDSWNEDNPFPSPKWLPHFTEPKADDSRSNTIDARRRGPFPIAVALETTVPAEWYSDKAEQPAKVRVALIGDGTLFAGRELTPAKERLLQYTCDWLLGRDDLLPREDQRWEYPRVELPPREQSLWKWGAWFGPPLLFAYLGLVVVLVRRLR